MKKAKITELNMNVPISDLKELKTGVVTYGGYKLTLVEGNIKSIKFKSDVQVSFSPLHYFYLFFF